MLYLLFTILLNTLIFSMFKVFPRYNIDNLQAIVVNYFTCVVTGCLFIGALPFSTADVHQPWFPWAVLMGLLFITLFNFIAWRTREDGMTTTTIANKLSLVIPVLFSVMLYHEQLSILNITGILAAFPAVYLTTKRKGEAAGTRNLLFPFLLFVLSGLLDTLVKYAEHYYLHDQRSQAVYTIYIFGLAGVFGMFVVLYKKSKGAIRLNARNLVAGVLLGIPNYFSIYYLIRFLNTNVLQSAAAIPVNNIGIVIASTLVAIFIFKEQLTWQRFGGLALSIIAIILIAWKL